MNDLSAVCDGVIGAPQNKKFCVAHPSQCDYYQQSRGAKKFQLGTDSLYVAMSPKKGAYMLRWFPACRKTFYLGSNTDIEDLLSNQERLVAIWHVYFDECKALEGALGENEL